MNVFLNVQTEYGERVTLNLDGVDSPMGVQGRKPVVLIGVAVHHCGGNVEQS